MYYNYYPYPYNQNINKKNYSMGKQDTKKYIGKCFNIGEQAPDFTLQGIVEGKPQKVTLSQLRGKWVVLFFYGSNFTFV